MLKVDKMKVLSNSKINSFSGRKFIKWVKYVHFGIYFDLRSTHGVFNPPG